MLILNRDFQPPADGWYHLARPGDIPHASSGLIQVVDQAALLSIVNRFKADAQAAGDRFAGLLVDFDHFSLDTDKPSEAAGWIMDLQNRKDGLWAQIRWSDTGEAAVTGGRYRFLSPVWNRADCEELGDKRIRPLRITNAAVTNDPNFKGLCPLSNRRNVKNSASSDKPETNIEEPMDYKAKLIELLGLGADAADADIEAAIAAKQADVANEEAEAEKKKTEEVVNRLRNRVKELETAALSAKVDATLKEFDGVITNREDVKAGLMANFDGTLKVLRGLKTAALPNRRDGKLPANDAGGQDDSAARAQAAKIRNRAKEIQATNRGLSFTSAFERAKAEIIS